MTSAHVDTFTRDHLPPRDQWPDLLFTLPALRYPARLNCAEALLAASTAAAFENVPTAADDVCLLAFTSGTTGAPKGTMHFHRDVLTIADTFSAHILSPRPDDLFCGSPPLAFTFGLGALLVFPLR